MKTRKGRRSPTIVLFLSLVCCVIQTCSGLATLASTWSGAIQDGDGALPVVLGFISAIVGNWMLPLLFLSICLLLRDRLVSTKLPNTIFHLRAIEITYWTLFTVIFLAGTAIAVFTISFQRLLWNTNSGFDELHAQVFGFGPSPFVLGMTFGMSSLWWLSAVAILVFDIYIKKTDRSLFLPVDKVSNLIQAAVLGVDCSSQRSKLLAYIRPLYITFIVQDIVLAIFISVGGDDEKTSLYSEVFSLLNTLLFNLCYCAITGIVTAIGMENVSLHSVASCKFFCHLIMPPFSNKFPQLDEISPSRHWTAITKEASRIFPFSPYIIDRMERISAISTSAVQDPMCPRYS